MKQIDFVAAPGRPSARPASTCNRLDLPFRGISRTPLNLLSPFFAHCIVAVIAPQPLGLPETGSRLAKYVPGIGVGQRNEFAGYCSGFALRKPSPEKWDYRVGQLKPRAATAYEGGFPPARAIESVANESRSCIPGPYGPHANALSSWRADRMV